MPAEISVDAAVNFLNEAERYFRRLPTLGEDATHWANQSNADNCAKIANLLIRQARKAHDDGQALLTAPDAVPLRKASAEPHQKDPDHDR